jgi:Fe-S-cluster containining protein
VEEFNKSREISSEAVNPRQWLIAYSSTRAHLATFESGFHCDPACTRPGCKNQDLQVPVSLIDLIGAAMHRDESVSANYHCNYSLGLFSNERDDWLRMVSLKVKKPCPFLENDLCSIYPVRPLACVLFPEYLVYEGKFEANIGKDYFRDYLCLRRPLDLSPERGRVVAKLKMMWERENFMSSYYLFNSGSCHVDFSNLIEELLHEAGSPRDTPLAERPEPRRIIPNQVLERFFLEHMATCQPFSGVRERILHLDNPEGLVRVLQLLQDNLLMKKLKHGRDDRTLVWRFIQGRVQAKRRSLTPSEYKFYG